MLSVFIIINIVISIIHPLKYIPQCIHIIRRESVDDLSLSYIHSEVLLNLSSTSITHSVPLIEATALGALIFSSTGFLLVFDHNFPNFSFTSDFFFFDLRNSSEFLAIRVCVLFGKTNATEAEGPVLIQVPETIF